MLPVSISSSGSDESSLKLLPPTLLITSTSSSDSSINCFNETVFSDLDFFFFLFAFICFSSLQLLQHRFLRNNLNKKLHHCTALLLIVNHIVEQTWTGRTGYKSVCIHILYVHIYSNLVPRTFCLSNIGWRERERQDALGIRLYIQQYIWIFYLSS